MLILLALSASSAAVPDRPCATSQLTPVMPQVRREARGLRVPALPGDKAVRDPYGTPHEALSPNFAVHWGDEGGVTQAEVDRLLTSFELAWLVQLDEMGHEAPYGTEDTRFNVYIGDSGDGAPPGYGAGGYYWVDNQRWPMVVIGAATLDDPTFADHAASHELYHAVQGATDRFAYEGISAWYLEATAEWAAIETDPTNPQNGPFLFAYGLLPNLPVSFFDYPDTGTLEEYYQYGAFLFPSFISDTAGWEVIRDSWSYPGAEPDPVEVLRELLADQGLDLNEVWLDHVAHNAVWDYPHGDQYARDVELFGGYYGVDNVSASHEGRGTEGLTQASQLMPMRYGCAMIQLTAPAEGDLLVAVEGEERGTVGNPARFGARIVRSYDGGASLEYLDVPFEGVMGGLTVPGVGAEDELWLVVGSWTETDSDWDSERFVFSYQLEVVDPPEPADTSDPADTTGDSLAGAGAAPEEAKACGCGVGSGVSWAWWPLTLVGLARRRRS